MTQSAPLRNHESIAARSVLLQAARYGWRTEIVETNAEYTVYRVYPSHAYSYEIRAAN